MRGEVTGRRPEGGLPVVFLPPSPPVKAFAVTRRFSASLKNDVQANRSLADSQPGYRTSPPFTAHSSLSAEGPEAPRGGLSGDKRRSLGRPHIAGTVYNIAGIIRVIYD
jgi:hypothetical protein